MSATLSSPELDEILGTQNTDKTLGRLSEKGNQQSKAFCFGTKFTSRHVMTKRKFIQWPRVEISVWALIPVLNIAAIQYMLSVL